MLFVSALASVFCSSVLAAEGFQVRYNLAGSIGPDIFAKHTASGFVGGVVQTSIRIDKITGDDGNNLKVDVPGGKVTGTPFTYGASKPVVAAEGTLDTSTFVIGYIGNESESGIREIYGFNVGYGHKAQSFKLTGQTPSVNFPNGIPGATQSAVNAGLNTSYQKGIAAMAYAETGSTDGFGDAEFSFGVARTTGDMRVVTTATLITPTGTYNSAAGPDIGYGNFYTLRPSIQATYKVREDFGVGAKLTLGFNTNNTDNSLKSGDWFAYEAGASYMTRLGPIGVQLIHVEQYDGDTGNSFGSSKLQTTNAGVFFTTKIPTFDIILTGQFASTLDSKNSKSGTFGQLRLSKMF
jgi:predicted porin